MTQQIPTIQQYMTNDPIFVDADETLFEAQNIMKNKDIRHLPVMKNNEIYGIISDRDIKLVESIIKADQSLLIKNVCHTHVYTVDPDAHIDDVAEVMYENHFGCAVVVQNGKLTGIFTTVDACRALCDITRHVFDA